MPMHKQELCLWSKRKKLQHVLGEKFRCNVEFAKDYVGGHCNVLLFLIILELVISGYMFSSYTDVIIV